MARGELRPLFATRLTKNSAEVQAATEAVKTAGKEEVRFGLFPE